MSHEIAERLVRAVEPSRQAKRRAWDALQRECPEFIDDVHEIAGRFGIAGVTVQAGGETVAWGDTRGHRECPFGDETCPCQDGDPCHYVDLPGSPAMEPPR